MSIRRHFLTTAGIKARAGRNYLRQLLRTRRRRLIAWTFALISLAFILLWPLPSGRELLTAKPRITAPMELRSEQAARDGRTWSPQWRWVALSAISRNLQRAVIVAEDGNFYSHNGFDTDEIVKSLEESYERGELPRGASTITQQLAKNLYLSPSRNPIRKLREALITWRLEGNLSKQRILEVYLNVIEWGDGIFGAEAAARYYFKKSASTLSMYEAAYLAAIIPGPTGVFNPKRHPQRVERRAQLILRRMTR